METNKETNKIIPLAIPKKDCMLITPSQLCDMVKQGLREKGMFADNDQMLVMLIKKNEDGDPTISYARAKISDSECILVCEITKNFFMETYR